MANYFVIESNTSSRVTLKFDGNPIVIGQKYLLSQQHLLTATKNIIFRASPIDSFTYSIYNDDIKSENISTVTLKYPVTIGSVPSITTDIPIGLNQIINVSDYIPYSNTFDRINIKEIIGKGLWDLEDSELQEGRTYMYYEIADKLKFSSITAGPQNTYARLKFSHGSEAGDFEDDNQITFDVSALAILESGMDISTREEIPYTFKEWFLQASLLPVAADIRILVTINIATFEDDPDNELLVTVGDDTYDAESLVAGPADINGIIPMYMSLRMKTAFTEGDNIVMQLVDINGLAGLSPIDPDLSKNTLTFNF